MGSGPVPCGAVFRADETSNAPASCALRFNHLGPHRSWGQVADDREELLETLRGVLAALTQSATFPADVELARTYARAAIKKAEGRHG